MGPHYRLDIFTAFFTLLVWTNAVLQIWRLKSSYKVRHQTDILRFLFFLLWHVDYAKNLLEDGKSIEPNKEKDEKRERI